MIIASAPLRVSLFGGGSDFESYYKKNKSGVLSFAINKYVNVIIKKSFNNYFTINYSKKEICKNIEDIKHPIIREVLKFYNVKEFLEITSISDIPSKGSGLGSSSAFACALIKCICKFLNKKISNRELARIACFIEIKKCKSNIGIQDQFATSIGGFNFLVFKKNNKVLIKEIKIKNLDIKNFFLVSTNFYRSANKILKFQQEKKNFLNRNTLLNEIVKIAYQVFDLIKKNKKVDYGFYLNKSWQLKKRMSKKITNRNIDNLYKFGIKSGSTGGKLLGAGGGGFILFYVPQKKHCQFLNSFKKHKVFRPKLDFIGTKAIKIS